ncbi:MAG: hypothetical protein J3R72DRAFT_440056 [Linnemannia gamsii]|nr:MAG: hypothetical protein J3R72DRAFT_440056 [Linnemannia gamsii]
MANGVQLPCAIIILTIHRHLSLLDSCSPSFSVLFLIFSFLFSFMPFFFFFLLPPLAYFSPYLRLASRDCPTEDRRPLDHHAVSSCLTIIIIISFFSHSLTD